MHSLENLAAGKGPMNRALQSCGISTSHDASKAAQQLWRPCLSLKQPGEAGQMGLSDPGLVG